MRIVNEREVFNYEIWGKSVLWSPAVHLYDDEALFIFSITSSRYRVATAKTQRRSSNHCCSCIIMCIPPTTVMQLSRSLEIPLAQIAKKHIECNIM